MPSQQASPIHLSPIQQELLQRMVHRTKSEQRLVKRGHIILEAAEGTSNTKIAQQWQVDYETARRWRGDSRPEEDQMQGFHKGGEPRHFTQAVSETLFGGNRPGGTGRLSSVSSLAP